jgi:hypothetical protein
MEKFVINTTVESISLFPVNKEVNVNSFYFARAGNGLKSFKSFPRQIELEGEEYTFLESGLRYLVRKGAQLVQLFDMSDGDNNTYRLRLEDNQWTLVGMKAGI